MATLASTVNPSEPSGIPPQEQLPCIYGKDVCADCSVRQTLAHPDISRWQKPKNSAFDDFQGIMTLAANMMNPSIMELVMFCEHCPYLDVFNFDIVFQRTELLEKLYPPKKGKES